MRRRLSRLNSPPAQDRDNLAVHIFSRDTPVIAAVIAIRAEVAEKKVAVGWHGMRIGDGSAGNQVGRVEDFLRCGISVNQELSFRGNVDGLSANGDYPSHQFLSVRFHGKDVPGADVLLHAVVEEDVPVTDARVHGLAAGDTDTEYKGKYRPYGCRNHRQVEKESCDVTNQAAL